MKNLAVFPTTLFLLAFAAAPFAARAQGGASRPRTVSGNSPGVSAVERRTPPPKETTAPAPKTIAPKSSNASGATSSAHPAPSLTNPVGMTNAQTISPAQTATPNLAAAAIAPTLPAHKLAVNDIRARIAEAQRLLATRAKPSSATIAAQVAPPVPLPTPAAANSAHSVTTNSAFAPSASPTPNSAAAPNSSALNAVFAPKPAPTPFVKPIYFVTVAALETEAKKPQIHLVTLSKDFFLTRGATTTLTTSLGAIVRVQILRANGVNTALSITDMSGHQFAPLVVEYPIERGGAFRENAYYTSAHPALLSPELVKTGQNYVRTMLDLAAKRLKDKGFFINPQIVDVAEHLCVVEHVDHDRFRREDRRSLFEEIYSLYALNELYTYRFSVSSAGAGGMVQMIPSTYFMIRNMHPKAGLNPDFVAGMRNHGNALEAMLLYMQDTWNSLIANEEINAALTNKIATQPELLAAGYNSNPAKLAAYLRRGGDNWRALIPRETQMYLQIYGAVENLIQFKPRAEK